jgi:hypothetical protein
MEKLAPAELAHESTAPLLRGCVDRYVAWVKRLQR